MPKTKRISERNLQNRLCRLLEGRKGVKSARSFEDVSLLTRDKGVVLRFENGQEFQLTIVDSTR